MVNLQAQKFLKNKDGLSIQTEGFLDSNDKIAKDAISNSSLVSEDGKSIKIKNK